MASLFHTFFDPKMFASPYQTPEDALLDRLRQCQLVLSAFLPCFAPSIPWAGADLGPNPDPDRLRCNVLIARDKALFHIHSREQASANQGAFLAVPYVSEVFHLTELEQFALILWLLPAWDERFGGLFAALQSDQRRRQPGMDLILKLYFFADKAEDIPGFADARAALKHTAVFALLDSKGALDSRIADFLLRNGTSRLESSAAESYMPPRNAGPLPMREEDAQRLAHVLTEDDPGNSPLYLCLRAPEGAGRSTRVRRVAQLLDVPVVFFDCSVCSSMQREEFFSALHTAGRECILVQGMLALRHFEALLDDMETARNTLDLAGRFSGAVFVLTSEDSVTIFAAADRRWIEIDVALPDKRESIQLWERELSRLPLSEPIEPAEMANKFTFTPGQILGTGRTALGEAMLLRNLSRQDVTAAAYRQVSHKLDEHATLIYARHTWDQLILADAEKEMLHSACDQVRFQHIVYDQWGFDQRLAYGKGVSMLFAGPPGTGKTMAAQVVAHELGIEMYKVDLSRVVSKYIGETEKNLNVVFNEARKSNVILFFDETDAILGKRTEVKDSHDKNANLETSYLLQKMEEYNGITVMTTNYKDNIDSAFFRRISYVINFPFPDVKARKAIWKGIFPKQTPLEDDVDFDYLARQFEIAGGNIKNIALVASFLSARQNQPVGMRQLIKAISYEMAKQGKIMRKEDYGEYSYLLR